MAKASQPTTGLVRAGRASIQDHSGSVEVILPADVVSRVRLAEGEQVADWLTQGGGMVLVPPGAPEPSDVVEFGKFHTLQYNSRSWRLIVTPRVAKQAGVAGAEDVGVAFEPGSSTIRLIDPRGDQ